MNKKIALVLLTASQLSHAQDTVELFQEPVATNLSAEVQEITEDDSNQYVDASTYTLEQLQLLTQQGKLRTRNGKLLVVVTPDATTAEIAPVLPEIVPPVEPMTVAIVASEVATPEVEEVVVSAPVETVNVTPTEEMPAPVVTAEQVAVTVEVGTPETTDVSIQAA